MNSLSHIFRIVCVCFISFQTYFSSILFYYTSSPLDLYCSKPWTHRDRAVTHRVSMIWKFILLTNFIFFSSYIDFMFILLLLLVFWHCYACFNVSASCVSMQFVCGIFAKTTLGHFISISISFLFHTNKCMHIQFHFHSQRNWQPVHSTKPNRFPSFNNKMKSENKQRKNTTRTQ